MESQPRSITRREEQMLKKQLITLIVTMAPLAAVLGLSSIRGG
jgi:hypothetical protein